MRCLCSHPRHDIPGKRWQPCPVKACGCHSFRPDPRPAPEDEAALWIADEWIRRGLADRAEVMRW